ncbi:MAG: lipoyl(octanoyl) transferase LipB [Alphaproteobacteria bacterium]
MIEWKISDRPVPYEEAVAFMDARVAGIHEGREAECIWLLEHPPLYTGGTSAKVGDLLDSRFPVFKTGRGGEYTYHGPGQRVVYVMLDLKKRQKLPDIKQYVCDLESWIIRALAELGVTGEQRKGRVGIWVKVPHPSSPLARTPSPSREREDQYSEAKIAALGVRVRHWVTLHGISINVNPDLSHFNGIVPCGIKEYGVTSLADLGVSAGMEALDAALRKNLPVLTGSPLSRG